MNFFADANDSFIQSQHDKNSCDGFQMDGTNDTGNSLQKGLSPAATSSDKGIKLIHFCFV